MDRAAYDIKHALPNLFVLALCVAGLLVTPARWAEFPLERGTLMVTSMWNVYNVAILSAAVMVALERPQRRTTWRVRREHLVRLTLPAHPEIAPILGETLDMSEGGIRLRIPFLPEGTEEVLLDIESAFHNGVRLAARVVNRFAVDGEVDIRVEFTLLSPADEQKVIELMFSDADSWTHRPISQHPLQSLLTVVYAPWRALVLSLRDDEIEADR